MKQTTATVLGFCIASVVPAAWLSLTAPLSGVLDVHSVVGTFIVLYFFSALATILFGVPSFLLLRRWGRINWWSVLATGLCLGAIVAVVIRLPNRLDVHDLFTMAPLAAVSAFAFWLIWRTGK